MCHDTWYFLYQDIRIMMHVSVILPTLRFIPCRLASTRAMRKSYKLIDKINQLRAFVMYHLQHFLFLFTLLVLTTMPCKAVPVEMNGSTKLRLFGNSMRWSLVTHNAVRLSALNLLKKSFTDRFSLAVVATAQCSRLPIIRYAISNLFQRRVFY